MKNGGYFAAVVLCWLIPFIVVVLRFWVLKTPIRSLTPNDCGIILTQLFQLILLPFGIALAAEITEDYSNYGYAYFLKIFYAETFVYLLTIWTIKFSINALYLRLTFNTSAYKYAVGSLVLISLTGATALLLQTFSCWPISSRWSTDPDQSCPRSMQMAVFWVYYVMNMITDIVLFLIPFPLLNRITNRPLKIALLVIFTLFLLVLVMATIRISLLYVAPMDNIQIIHILSNVQCALASMIASLPGLSSPLTRWVEKRGRKQGSGRLDGYHEGKGKGCAKGGDGSGEEFLTSALGVGSSSGSGSGSRTATQKTGSVGLDPEKEVRISVKEVAM